MTDLAKAGGIVLQDSRGREVRLESHWQKQDVVVALVRHFG